MYSTALIVTKFRISVACDIYFDQLVYVRIGYGAVQLPRLVGILLRVNAGTYPPSVSLPFSVPSLSPLPFPHSATFFFRPNPLFFSTFTRSRRNPDLTPWMKNVG